MSSRGCRLGELPDAVGGLSRLQTLSLASCGLRQLPEAIGCLRHVITLDVAQNTLPELPASLGERWGPVCCELKVGNDPSIEPCHCAGKRTAEDARGHFSGDMPALLSGTRVQTGDMAHPLHIVSLTAGDCSALERLSADSNQLTALPSSLARLQKLAVISAARNKCAHNMPTLLYNADFLACLAQL